MFNAVVVAVGDGIEAAVGTYVCPLCSFLLARCGLLIASEKVLFWRGLFCSTEAQDGEEAEEEEEGRGRSAGEAGGLVGFSFSIMVVKSLEGNPSLSQAPVTLSCLACALSVNVCQRVLSLWCLYMCVRVTIDRVNHLPLVLQSPLNLSLLICGFSI